jgi:hypothetical protein
LRLIPESVGRIPLPRWVENLPEILGSTDTGRRLRRFLGPAPKARELRVICSAGALIPLLLLIAMGAGKGELFGWKAGQHFAAFYNAGTILNRGLGSQLYDLNLQTTLLRELFPTNDGASLYPNAPWFALLFRPFALLPFSWAYVAWVLFSIALYLSGLALIWPKGLDFETRRTAFLAAVSFQPFVFQTLISGQVTAVAFFLITAAIRLLRDGRCLAAGCVLSGCLYKPTMLVLLLPMLLLSGRWKALAGVAAGALMLVAVSVLCVAPSSLASYRHLMDQYSQITFTPQGVFFVWPGGGLVQSFPNFIDGHHFFRMLPGGGSIFMLALAAACGAFLFYLLAPLWVKCGSADAAVQSAVWGATITLTVVLNLHAQHYDSVLLVAGVVTSWRSFAGHSDQLLRSAYFRVCLLLWCFAWVSQVVTRVSHVQVYSLAILLLGLLQIATVPRVAGKLGRAVAKA